MNRIPKPERYYINTGRYLKARGRKWEADTPEEAIRLRQELERSDAPEAFDDSDRDDHLTRHESVWIPDVFEGFIQGMGSHQLDAVRVLVRNPSIRADKLADAIGVSGSSLAGVLSGLSKQLRKLELKQSQLYLIHTEWDGEKSPARFS